MKKLALVLVLVASAQTVSGQTVLVRARIGNNVEGMTYVGNGPLQDSLVLVDGHQLRSVSAQPCWRACYARDLLDLKTLPIVSKINGLAYVSAERIFLLWDISQADTWFLLDQYARPLPATRKVNHLPGLGAYGAEGMVYVPSSASRFADRIIASVYDANAATHIEVLRRDGQAEAEIVPKGALDASLESITGLGYKAPNQLLVGTIDHSLWVMDFDGNVVQGPVDASPNWDFEGMVQTAGGKIVAAPYSDGTLLFFDASLNRLPHLDRDVRIGPGKSRPRGAAWDPKTQSILVNSWGFGPQPRELDSLPVSLDSAIKLTDLPAGSDGLTYLDAERRIGVTHGQSPRAVLLYDDFGALKEEVDLQDPASDIPRQLAYVPSRQQFVLKYRGDNLLHFASRSGAFVRDIDLSAFGLVAFQGLAFFPAAPGDPNPAGNLAVTDGTRRTVTFIDVDGTRLLGRLDYRSPSTLDMIGMRLGYIDQGPLAGSFLGFDELNSEVIVFRR